MHLKLNHLFEIWRGGKILPRQLARRKTTMNDKGSSLTLRIIILTLGAFAFGGCSQLDSIPASTVEPTPTPEILTATGLTPQENIEKYGVPGEIVPFEYPVPDGMIQDPAEIQAMIEAKIAHLEEINRRFWGDAPGTSEQRQEVFDELWGILDDYFVAFNRLDIDWDEFYEENIEVIANVESYGEYAYVITNMGYVLQEVHTYAEPSRVTTARDRSAVYMPETRYVPWFEPSGYDSRFGGCYAVTSETELVFYLVQEAPQNPYHLQIGDEFIGFNGVSWKDWIPAIQASRLPRGGSPAASDLSLAFHLLQSGMQNAQLFETINIRRVDTGRVETLNVIPERPRYSLDCSDWMSPDGWVSSEDLNHPVWMDDDDVFGYGVLRDENVGYMVLRNFLLPEGFESEFERAVSDLVNTDGLIIDLRGTSGGNFSLSDFSAFAHLVRGTEDRYFFSWAVNALSSDDRSTLADIREGWGEDCQHAIAPDRLDIAALCERASGYDPLNSVLRADDPDEFYTKPIMVLVGPYCYSACDYFVYFLSQFPETTFIGRNPNGSATSLNIWGRTYDYPE